MAEFGNKEIQTWKDQYPLLNKLISLEEVFWLNPNIEKFELGMKKLPLTQDDVRDAEERLKRFTPYIAKVFPETEKLNGIIESPLVEYLP